MNIAMDFQARLLLEAAEQLGWRDDALAIAERARRLKRGLPAEDEFSVILSWLGRCRLVHKLDQMQHPLESKEKYRIPDLLAIFEYDSVDLPVLIEVKTSVKPKLSWTADYLAGLQAYARLINLPLLVAWKWRDLWALFDTAHFKLAVSNYNIKFLEALKNTLMSLLAGDFNFTLRPGVGIHLFMKKLKQESEDSWLMEIERAYFTDADGGERINAPGLMALFMCVRDDVHVVDEGTHIRQSFIIPDGSEGQMAHRCLVQLISVFGDRDQPMTWRSYLQGTEFPAMSIGLHDAARNLGPAFIERLFTFRPAQHPSFLPLRPNSAMEPTMPPVGM